MLNNYEEAAKLKTKAARYRTLAQTVVDPELIADVQALARELDSEAARLENWAPRKTA